MCVVLVMDCDENITYLSCLTSDKRSAGTVGKTLERQHQFWLAECAAERDGVCLSKKMAGR